MTATLEAGTRTATKTTGGGSRLDTLQALRALAATTVIFDHIPFVRCGAFGVDLFFVLSGFVICHISVLDSKHFFLKRIFRVVPLYWLCTIGVALIAILWPDLLVSTSFSMSSLLKSLLFIPFRRSDRTVAPLLFLGWTLQFEMLFYAIFAAALKVTRKYSKELVVGALISLVILGKIARITHHGNVVLNFYCKFVILEFAFGILCYSLWGRHQETLRRIPGLLTAIPAALGYGFYIVMETNTLSSYGPILRFVPDFLLRGLPAAIILLAFLSLEQKFKFPALVLLVGDASYSLYLLHPYILEALNRKLVSLGTLNAVTVLATTASVGVCYLCAIVSFKVFEYPSNIFLRRYFLYERRKATAANLLRISSSVRLKSASPNSVQRP